MPLFLLYAVSCLPGFFITLLPWRRARQMSAGLSKYATPSLRIAAAFAPMIYGHGILWADFRT
jgi:hypothetical protein